MTDVIVALVAAVPATVAAIAAVIAARRSTQVNDAVNHRHVGAPRLLDIVRRNSTQIERLTERLSAHDEWERGIASALGTRQWAEHKEDHHP